MERDAKDNMQLVEVRVVFPDGRELIEVAEGRSRRGAVWAAREKYRDRARVDPVDASVM